VVIVKNKTILGDTKEKIALSTDSTLLKIAKKRKKSMQIRKWTETQIKVLNKGL